MWAQVIGQLAKSEVQVVEDQNKLTVTGSVEVINRLKENISSRATTRELMQNFAIKPREFATTLEEEVAAEKIALKTKETIENKQVFNRLFQDALEGMTLLATTGSVDWDDEATKDNVLYTHPRVVTFRQGIGYGTQVKALQALLATTNLASVRSAFSDIPMPEQVEEDALGPFSTLSDKIIGLIEEPVENDSKKKNVKIFFDCGRLLGLVTFYNYEQISESEIVLDKPSFVDFLAASLPQSLAITKPGLKPIVAEPKDSLSVKTEHHMHLLIDCSGSIGVLRPYFEKIAAVVAKMPSEQIVHTTLFSTGSRDLFPMKANNPSYLEELLKYEHNLSEGTYLEGSILKILDKIAPQIVLKDHYFSVMVMTDGADNSSSAEEKTRLRQRMAGYERSPNPPNFTFVQIGSYTNKAFFDEFSRLTCATSIDLENPAKFEPLYHRIELLSTKKADIYEFLDQQNRVIGSVRPIIGDLTEVDLKLPTSFSYGKRGKEPTKFNPS